MIYTHAFHPDMWGFQVNFESDSFCPQKGYEQVFLMWSHDLFIAIN